MTALADEYAPARCGLTVNLTHRHVRPDGSTAGLETSTISCALAPDHEGLHANPALGWEWRSPAVGPRRTTKWRKDRGRRR